jgi:hypothetical protein
MKREEQMMKKEQSNLESLLLKPFNYRNTIPAIKLGGISQSKIQELIIENHILALSIRNEPSIIIMGIEELADIRDKIEEQREYIEQLEQRIEEMEIINELGEEYFQTPETDFVEIPENMSAKQFREWIKETKEKS